MAVLAGALALVGVLAASFARHNPPVAVTRHWLVGSAATVALAFIPIMAVYRAPALGYVYMAGGVVLILVVPYAIPILFRPRARSWRAQTLHVRQGLHEQSTIAATLVERVGPNLVRTVAVATYTLVSPGVGDAAALYRIDFLVKQDTDPPQVLLVNYGNTLIFAPIDPDTGEILEERIIEMVGGSSLDLRWERIGPLDSDITD